MNVLQKRMANSVHVLGQNRSGSRTPNYALSIGEELVVREDVDVQVEEGILSVPAGTRAKITNIDPQMVSLDLGQKLGGFEMTREHVEKYFSRGPQVKESIKEEFNDLGQTPGRRIVVTQYDPKIGPNRGPKSPGMGGYESLVGQKGEIQTVFGVINGVKTYRVNLVSGGQFILGETEFEVLNENVSPGADMAALRSFGLVS